jgi:hypothetical protein
MSPAAGLAINNSGSITFSGQQLMITTGWQFNIWLKLIYECCVKCQWQNQPPDQEEVPSNDVSSTGGTGYYTYSANTASQSGTSTVASDVQAELGIMRTNAKNKCSQFA